VVAPVVRGRYWLGRHVGRPVHSLAVPVNGLLVVALTGFAVYLLVLYLLTRPLRAECRELDAASRPPSPKDASPSTEVVP